MDDGHIPNPGETLTSCIIISLTTTTLPRLIFLAGSSQADAPLGCIAFSPFHRQPLLKIKKLETRDVISGVHNHPAETIVD